jgi:hypothetical protein
MALLHEYIKLLRSKNHQLVTLWRKLYLARLSGEERTNYATTPSEIINFLRRIPKA